MKGIHMKKIDKTDELRSEYDITQLTGCVVGKYAERAKAGSNIILLDKDVAEVFKDDASVNEALRTLIRLHGSARSHRRTTRLTA
jgi:adenylate cyclase